MHTGEKSFRESCFYFYLRVPICVRVAMQCVVDFDTSDVDVSRLRRVGSASKVYGCCAIKR